jgi:hypothetical protein
LQHWSMDTTWDESRPRSDAETVAAYAEWLGKIPWQLFSTFTFARRVSDEEADVAFRAFINEIERQVRSPIAFVRGDEKRSAGFGLPESGRHYHVLLTSHTALDPVAIAKTWRGYGGNGKDYDSSKVDPFIPELKGAEYCLKMINETEGNWKFRNLHLFLPGYTPGKDNKRSRRRKSRNDSRSSVGV